MSLYLDLLRRNANYRNLWLAKVVSFLGDWFNLLASAALLSSITASGTAVSVLFLARLLPLFFVTPVAGVLADRYNRKQIMVASDVLRAVTVLGFLLVRSNEQIWLFYLLTVVQFMLSALFTPAQSALLPNLVAEEDLVTANALDGFTWSTMLAVGALLGGVAAALFGVTAAYIIDSLSFLLSAYLVTCVVLPPAVWRSSARPQARGGFLQFIDGLRYLRSERFILVLALVKAAGALVWGAVNVLEITLAQQRFPLRGSGTLTLGLIYFTVGLGTAIGPLLMRRWIGDSRVSALWAISAGFGLLTLGVLGLGLAPTLGWVIAATLVRSIGSGSLWVFSSAILQMTVTDVFRGRTFAFEFAAFTLCQSIATLYAGIAQDVWGVGVQAVFLSLAALSLLLSLAWSFFQLRTTAHPVAAR